MCVAYQVLDCKFLYKEPILVFWERIKGPNFWKQKMSKVLLRTFCKPRLSPLSQLYLENLYVQDKKKKKNVLKKKVRTEKGMYLSEGVFRPSCNLGYVEQAE